MKEYEKAVEVPADVSCKASASLQEEVLKELEVEDPELEMAKAVLERKNDED